MMGRYDKYSPDVRQVISLAREEAQRLRHRLISSEHLLLGLLLLHHVLIEGVFAALHVLPISISQAIEFVVGRGNRAILSEPALSVAARSILARAEEIAAEQQIESIEIEHIFLALLDEPDSVVLGVLESFGIQVEAARDQLCVLMNGGYERLLQSTHYHTRYDATPILNQVSRDLTLAALDNQLDPLIGRAVELERTMQILTRRTKNNPVLIGPAGVGKTAIAEGLAVRIVQGMVPECLLNYRIVAIEVGMLSVGTKFRGDLEERFQLMLQEIVHNPDIIIFIDELHTLAQTGVAEGSLDVSNLFKPMLARGEFQCIGATTLDEYRKTIEADAALERRFQPVLIAEPTEKETITILRELRPRYELFHHVTISDDALLAAVRLSSRYIPNRYQPDKALDLLDEASARAGMQHSLMPQTVQQLRDELVKMQHAKEYAISQHDFPRAGQCILRERLLRQQYWQAEQEWREQAHHSVPVVEIHTMEEIVALWTGIPVTNVSAEERLRLLHLEDELHQRVVGQHVAVEAVAHAIRRSRVNMRNSQRPIGSFVFVGPTGVGKTELARAIAATLFGDENALLKLDMSEFMEMHQVARLVSAPPGYIGYDQAGQLTEAVRRRPFSVILFDEIEKAHSRVVDLLLQILEDGCLTDAHGKKVDFKHTIIILTSNVGTMHHVPGILSFTARRDERNQHVGNDRLRERVLQGMKELFSPELLNRLDDVIVFHPLELSHAQIITDNLIAQTICRLAAKKIVLQVSSAARSFLVSQGYSYEYGARALRRTVQRLLDDMLAELLLRNIVNSGDDVFVDLIDGQLQAHVHDGFYKVIAAA
ncbi:MAG TPA: ATP-dependent Clp protease ATP-binding subunit [Dictyobacter sp.]|jgi:ATP-dependent Clp protease ATP-binding subunit ClpC|nr:ATP-dependent Clp protease ATP-binding subunit [Dictyobacter sp.]